VDYAFAPGTEDELRKLQQLLRDRTDPDPARHLDTTLIDTPAVTTIAEFIKHVDTTFPLPTDDLVLGAHATNSGAMTIDLDAIAPHQLDYQALKDAHDDVTRRNRLNIPPDMYTTSSGGRQPVRVLIKGCRVGQAPKFVDGLKQLFGGKIPIIAPKHFESASSIVKTRRRRIVGAIGSVEYLLYSNELISRAALSRPALVKAFHDRGFTQFDAAATPIPDLWEKKWIPTDVSPGKRALRKPFVVSLGRDVGNGRTTLTSLAEFRHYAKPWPVPIDNPPASVKTLAGFKAALAARPEYQPGWGPTGFPKHEQLGPLNLDGSPTTFDQFFDSYTWTPPKKKSADPFTWVGVRHKYNVLLPVVQTPMTGTISDRLIYDFFPARGTGGTPFIELLESDAGLFYVSPGS
jgi:hypothetical protein